jgi:hypothetical protein
VKLPSTWKISTLLRIKYRWIQQHFHSLHSTRVGRWRGQMLFDPRISFGVVPVPGGPRHVMAGASSSTMDPAPGSLSLAAGPSKPVADAVTASYCSGPDDAGTAGSTASSRGLWRWVWGRCRNPQTVILVSPGRAALKPVHTVDLLCPQAELFGTRVSSLQVFP